MTDFRREPRSGARSAADDERLRAELLRERIQERMVSARTEAPPAPPQRPAAAPAPPVAPQATRAAATYAEPLGGGVSVDRPERPVSQRAARPVRRKQLPLDTWRQRLFADAAFVAVGMFIWCLNAYFTAAAVSTALGGSVLAWLIGFAIHFGISRVELYSLHRWREIPYLIGIVLAIGVDVVTTLTGLVETLTARNVTWIQGISLDLLAWTRILWIALLNGVGIGTVAPDPSIGKILTLLVIAVLVALCGERVLRHYWRGLQDTWQERPSAA